MINNYKNNEVTDREFRLYFTELSTIPLLSLTQEKALGARIRQGDTEAVTELVRANLRFVIKIAKEYCGRGVSFLDLINEGNLGLIQAAWRFDPAKNVKFISYAVWWVRESMAHSIASFSGPLQFPTGIFQYLRRIEAIVRKKTAEQGRVPSLEEVAIEIGIGVNKLSSILKYGEYVYVSQTRSESDAIDLRNVLKASGPETDPFLKMLYRQIHQILAELSDLEEKVLKLRYGIEGEMTLQQIGDLFGLSRERIRQIELTALQKCKQRLSRLAAST